MKKKENWRKKKLIVFDLDGTLTESKSDMDHGMSSLLGELLAKRKVAVIGGGRYEQFRRQFVRRLNVPHILLRNLFLFPTSSTSFYRHRDGWKKVYQENLSKEEKAEIRTAFKEALRTGGYARPRKTWGVVIEDRGTQITFSALGQKAPVRAKERWNKSNDNLRKKIARILAKHLPRFEVRTGGLTSVDVTRKGIDKAYGIRQIEKHLKIPRNTMLFVGDAIYPGGNDYAIVKTGVDYVKISGPEETKKLIRNLLGRGAS